ncbi:hypothetical protein AB0K64_29635 [Streptomyces sp. NPDC053741]|uniref:hypothetical protein n=1 Tax=Streptomyces TaxID=1883 RepID=UPI002F916A7F
MDSAIAAALVATPTAALAATAAYAAGRAQARAAQRGPVDAVRRQHQRDAYAAFLRAAWSYLSSTGRVFHLVDKLYDVRLPRNLDPEVLERLIRRMQDRSGPQLDRADLAAAFAPAEVPRTVDNGLATLEILSPTWQQDIRDAVAPHQINDLMLSEAVVSLEGPEHLAELAEQLRIEARSVQRGWSQLAGAPFLRLENPQDELHVAPHERHKRLEKTVEEFTQAARAHLNAH